MMNNTTETLGAESIILGFTGSLGSGCTFLSKEIEKRLGKDGYYFRVSSILRDIAEQQGIKNPTVHQLQDIGNELRQERPSAILEKCLEKIKSELSKSNSREVDSSIILIDGIRNDGEVRYLRQFPNFYLFSIHAEKETREKRLVGADSLGQRFNTPEDFDKADKRDECEIDPRGQQVKKCNYLADVILDNNENFASSTPRKQMEFINRIYSDYFNPIISFCRSEETHDRPPKVDETLMTMAYCVSKRSSCLKRKVGAIIAYISNLNIHDENELRIDANKTFKVVSSGYNDVPLGTKPCIFEKYKECYRENTQKNHANKIIFCPNCGEKIPEDMKNSLITKECLSCHSSFDSFILGGKDSPGKLLDICRSLHAEENAIIGLSKGCDLLPGELVLYTTTFPCNLCANKIAAVGIKRVVFAEPYTMKESKTILDQAGVRVEKFQGIKSSAYFRLYC